eukprot:UC4_evm1s883
MCECQFEVHIVDQQAPEVSCPASITKYASVGTCSTSVDFHINATDNNAVADTSCTRNNMSEIFEVGIETVACSAKDFNNNTASCSFTVEVIDNEPPVFDNCITSWGNQTKMHVLVKIFEQIGDKKLLDFHVSKAKENISLMLSLAHENVLAVVGADLKATPPIIIFEWATYGKLNKYMEHLHDDGGKELEPFLQASFAKQVATGLDFLAKKDFISKDVAARNILVTSDYHCKIFNLERNSELRDDQLFFLTKSNETLFRWTAPEVKVEGTSLSSMVWQYGLFLYELATCGRLPYSNQWASQDIMLQTLELVRSGEVLPRPDNCHDLTFDLMCDCWELEKSNRPTMEKILTVSLPEILETEYFAMPDNYKDSSDSYRLSQSYVGTTNTGYERLSPKPREISRSPEFFSPKSKDALNVLGLYEQDVWSPATQGALQTLGLEDSSEGELDKTEQPSRRGSIVDPVTGYFVPTDHDKNYETTDEVPKINDPPQLLATNMQPFVVNNDSWDVPEED